MEQSGRIKSYAGDLSFEVTIPSPMITTEKKKLTKTLLRLLVSFPPQDNDLYCLLKNSQWKSSLEAGGSAWVDDHLTEILEDWSIWKLSTLVGNPVNYRLIQKLMLYMV